MRPGPYTFRVAARNWGGQWGALVEARFRVIRNRGAQETEAALERERIAKEVDKAMAERLEELNRQLEETDRLTTTLATDASLAYIERWRGRPLSPEQRASALRAIAGLEEAWAAHDLFAVPAGTEPAAVFHPHAVSDGAREDTTNE